MEEDDQGELGYSVLDKKDYDDYMNPFFTFRGYQTFDQTTEPNTNYNDGSPSGIMIKVISDGPEAVVEITK